jgi:hypothetical protein
MGVILCILVVFVIALVSTNYKEGLVSKPNDAEKVQYFNDIVNNKHIFGGQGTFYEAKEKMPWMDAIIYEDVRQLARQNNLNKNSVNSVFH